MVTERFRRGRCVVTDRWFAAVQESSRTFVALALLCRRRRLNSSFDSRRQIRSLAKQLTLNCPHFNIAWPHAGVGSKGSGNASGLAGEPALWDLAQKGM